MDRNKYFRIFSAVVALGAAVVAVRTAVQKLRAI